MPLRFGNELGRARSQTDDCVTLSRDCLAIATCLPRDCHAIATCLWQAADLATHNKELTRIKTETGAATVHALDDDTLAARANKEAEVCCTRHTCLTRHARHTCHTRHTRNEGKPYFTLSWARLGRYASAVTTRRLRLSG